MSSIDSLPATQPLFQVPNLAWKLIKTSIVSLLVPKISHVLIPTMHSIIIDTIDTCTCIIKLWYYQYRET